MGVRRRGVVMLLATSWSAGCGRVGFDPLAANDGAAGDGVSGAIPLACANPVLRDDFTGSLDAATWQFGTASRTANGALDIVTSDLNTLWGPISVARFDVKERWFAAELVAMPDPATNGGAGLITYIPAENDYVYALVTGGMLRVGVETAATPTPLFVTPFDPVAHRFVRIRDAGGMLTWDVSSDGSSWMTLASAPTPTSLTTNTTLRVVAYDLALPVDTTAIFDQFVLCSN